MLSVWRTTRQGRFSASSARIAASISMRLLVVRDSPPDSSFSCGPERMIAPQPPGPGLPLQAPSVKISTSVNVGSGGLEAVGELEDHSLDDALALDLGDVEMLAQAIDQLAHQQLGGGGACGEAERCHALHPAEVELGGAADEAGASALPLRDLDEADRVGAVGRTDH